MAPCSLATRVIPRMTDSVKPWVRREGGMTTKFVEESRRGKTSRRGVVTVLLDAGVRRLRATPYVFILAGAASGGPDRRAGSRAPAAARWSARSNSPDLSPA